MKTSHILFTGFTALSLAACGATTGTTVKSQAQQKTMKQDSTPVAPAAKVEMSAPSSLAINSMMSESTDCAALTTQIAEVEADITKANSVIEKDNDTMGKKVGSMALNQGASRALKSIPFGGFLAKSAIKSATDSGREKAEAAQARLNDANLRKANLAGLYAGKGCGT